MGLTAAIVAASLAVTPGMLSKAPPPGGAGKAPAGALNDGLLLWYPLTTGTSVVVNRGPTATVTAASPPDCLSDGAWETLSAGQLCTDATKGARFNDAVTNYALYSEDLSNAAWTLTTATVTTGQADPRGNTAAQTLTETATGGKACQTVTATASATYTLAAALKAGSAVTARISLAGDVTAESIGTCSVTTSWPYTETGRCYKSLTLGASDTTITACIYAGDGATSSQAVDVFGVSLTKTSVPHWYCPTTSASATCAISYATVDQGEGVAWQAAAGTIETTFTTDFDPTKNVAYLWSIDDGTSNNFIFDRLKDGAQWRIAVFEYANGSALYAWYPGSLTAGTYTLRHAWDTSRGAELWLGGVSKATDPDTNLAAGGTRTMYLGWSGYAGGGYGSDVWLRDLKVWRRRIAP